MDLSSFLSTRCSILLILLMLICIVTCQEQVGITCSERPCQNGGTCMNTYMVGKENRSYHCYICHCTDSFIGQDCETSLSDACMFNNLHVCQNEGICMEDEDNPGNVKCVCPDGYGGLYCEESIPYACMFNNPCQNEGICMEDEDNPDSVKCECPDWCGGLYCEKSIPWYLKANISIAALGGFAVFTILVILIISCAKARKPSSPRNELNVSDLLFAVGRTMASLATSRQRPTPSVNNHPDPEAVADEPNVPNGPMRGVNRDQENGGQENRVQGTRVQRNGDQENRNQGNRDQQNRDQENGN